MLSLIKSRSTVALALVVGTSFGALPMAAFAQDVAPQGGVKPMVSALPNIAYDVVYAVSSTANASQTVISIGNPSSTTTCQVQVEWLFGFGTPTGTPAGYSGPFSLPPQTTAEFTTAKSGTTIKPFILNVFRDTTSDFEGKARIRTNCPVTQKFGVNATVAVGSSYFPIKVIRPTGNVGD